MTRIPTRLAVFTAATAAVFIALPASAQESTTRGFLLGAHIGGSSIKVQDAERSNGGGGGITIGYGVNRSFTIYTQLDGSNIDVRNQPDVGGTWAMAHADFGVRFHFANSLKTAIPYLQGAFSVRAVSLTDIPTSNPLSGSDVTFSGGAFTLGGGFMLYFAESAAFDIGLLFSGGEFTQITVGNTTQSGFDIDTQSTRFNLGVSWWP
jgi:hypothetical protein